MILFRNLGITLGVGFFLIIVYGYSTVIQARPTCTPDQIDLKEFNTSKVAGTYLKITGEFVNNCPEATGVQLQLVVRDKAGVVMEASDFWPASIRNVPAGASYAWSRMVDYQDGMDKVGVKVIETKQWR